MTSDDDESVINIDSSIDDISMNSGSISNTNANDRQEQRRLVLIKAFSSGDTENFNISTMKSINRAVRLVAIPRIKFLPGSKAFGSFDQPNFSDPSCWVNKVFDRSSNLKNASDKKKAKILTTYKHKIREQFSLHRSGVTSRIKVEFRKGKNLIKKE